MSAISPTLQMNGPLKQMGGLLSQRLALSQAHNPTGASAFIWAPAKMEKVLNKKAEAGRPEGWETLGLGSLHPSYFDGQKEDSRTRSWSGQKRAQNAPTDPTLVPSGCGRAQAGGRHDVMAHTCLPSDPGAMCEYPL